MSLQKNYQYLSAQAAAAGQVLAGERHAEVLTRASGDISPKIAVITVDTAADSTVYSYSCAGVTVSYTSGVGATVGSISDGLAAAHNAALLPDGTALIGVCTANSDGAGDVTITALSFDDDFAISESDANLSLVITPLVAGVFMAWGIGADQGPGGFKTSVPHESGGDFIGIVKRFQRRNISNAAGATAEAGRPLPIITSGLCWVLLDAGQSPSPGDPVFCRHTATGSEVQGAFRIDADGGDADQQTNMKWIGGAVNDIDDKLVALVKIN